MPPPSASCACLQPRQFDANAGDAQGGGAAVTDQPAREADQDRCQGRQPWPLIHVPDGRGGSATADVQGDPAAHRTIAGGARSGVRGTGVRCNGQPRQKCVLIEANRQATHCFGLPAAPSWAELVAMGG